MSLGAPKTPKPTSAPGTPQAVVELKPYSEFPNLATTARVLRRDSQSSDEAWLREIQHGPIDARRYCTEAVPTAFGLARISGPYQGLSLEAPDPATYHLHLNKVDLMLEPTPWATRDAKVGIANLELQTVIQQVASTLWAEKGRAAFREAYLQETLGGQAVGVSCAASASVGAEATAAVDLGTADEPDFVKEYDANVRRWQGLEQELKAAVEETFGAEWPGIYAEVDADYAAPCHEHESREAKIVLSVPSEAIHPSFFPKGHVGRAVIWDNHQETGYLDLGYFPVSHMDVAQLVQDMRKDMDLVPKVTDDAATVARKNLLQNPLGMVNSLEALRRETSDAMAPLARWLGSLHAKGAQIGNLDMVHVDAFLKAHARLTEGLSPEVK